MLFWSYAKHWVGGIAHLGCRGKMSWGAGGAWDEREEKEGKKRKGSKALGWWNSTFRASRGRCHGVRVVNGRKGKKRSIKKPVYLTTGTKVSETTTILIPKISKFLSLSSSFQTKI